MCAAHERDCRHCVHFGQGEWHLRPWKCTQPGGCGEDCARDVPAFTCAEHGYTWGHCPHGSSPGDCLRGEPPGEIRVRGGDHLFATREAAEEYLYRREREREAARAEAEPELRRLKMAAANAHPDRGGSAAEFRAAWKRYQDALRRAS
jgi:hypothetical protein